MKKLPQKAIAAASIAMVLAGCNSSDNSPVDVVSMELRLLETTDIHANVMPYSYNDDTGQNLPKWGLARTAVVIENARSEVDNHLLIDNGDLIQGSPMGDYIASLDVEYLETARHPVFKAMNYLNYDAGNVGNHEFNYGLKFLDDAIKGANFPYVGSNVWKTKQGHDINTIADENCEVYLPRDEDDKPIFDQIDTLYDPYVILERDFLANNGEYYTLNVGVIGFTPPDIMAWDANHLECWVVVSDIIETAEHFVPKMKQEGADIIIAVPHSGLDKESSLHAENATYQLAKVDGIDAIMFGHDHKFFPNYDGAYEDFEGIDAEAGLIHGVPATMPGARGEALGVIDLSLTSFDGGQTWGVADTAVELRPLVERESDPVIEALVAEEHRGTIEYMGIEIAETDQYINSFFTQVIPDLSVQIVNQAQLHALEQWIESDPDAFEGYEGGDIVLSLSAPFKSGRNGHDDYTNINTGKLTNGSIADLYVFDNNTPAALKMTGKAVKEWIEWDASNQYRTLPLAEGESFLNSGYMGFDFDVFFGGFDDEGNSLLQYTIDVTVEPRYPNGQYEPVEENHRLVEILYDGKPLEDDAVVYAMTNSYRASEGQREDNPLPGVRDSEIVKADAAYSNRELVQQYFEYRLGLDSQEGTFLDFENAENFRLQAPGHTIQFSSSSDDESHICADQIEGLRFTGQFNEVGEKIFELNFDAYEGASFDCRIGQ